MTGEQLKNLESRLWKAADDLRANSKLTATEYSFPVLGLIFLRHAYNRFQSAKEEIEQTLPVHPVRGVRPIEKNDFLTAKAIYLPENAKWETIAGLPDGEDIGEFLNEAMRSIEAEYDVLTGVLPKDYNLFDKDLLQRLIRVFNDEALTDVSGDVFGRIYEYFLNKFAMSGAQEGGEFFTPPSLVNAIVNIIEPNHGVVFDPACGSAGMFVQTAHFIEDELHADASQKVTFFGQEKADTNTKLAKMNMAVHGLDATVVQGNSFYEDKHELVGQCDFVMANPPFNVDGVDKSKDGVKKDPRLPFGLPKNDNANYMWIQYFYSYLNENGRAGFVMASSASDAGHSEKEIRKQIIETGAVDVMVSIGTKFFYTRPLPCSLWFFDRSKEKDPDRADKTLMLDLREVYRKVSSNLHDFSVEQLKNIHAIVGLYRGNSDYFYDTIDEYFEEINKCLNQTKMKAQLVKQIYFEELNPTFEEVIGLEWMENQGESVNVEDLYWTSQIIDHYADVDLKTIRKELVSLDKENIDHYKKARRGIKNFLKQLIAMTKEAGKNADLKKNKKWKPDVLDKIKRLERVVSEYVSSIETVLYFNKEVKWLTERFPNGQYQDVLGLCKVVEQAEIAQNDFSLSSGRYVGVAPQLEEDFDYEERMADIKTELRSLDVEAFELAKSIQQNLTDLGL